MYPTDPSTHAVTQAPTLNYFELAGSPYQIGLDMGRLTAEVVHTQLQHSPLWESLRDDVSRDILQTMQTQVQTHHPYVLDEIQGLARGLELPFDEVFAWNCRADLHPQAVAGSTTVLLPGPKRPAIYHNEDGAAALKGHCALATITPDHGPAFATMIIPGTLPGNTFTVTEHGLVLVVDDLRWLSLEPGLPRTVLTRALLSRSDLSEVVSLLNRSVRSGGCHLALAHRSAGSLLSIEFNHEHVFTTAIDRPVIHTDHALNKQWGQTPQLITPSSQARHQRLNQLLEQANPVEPIAMLADQQDSEWPVFRERPASDRDGKKTLASVALEVGDEQVEWAVYEHPGQAVRFHMRNAHHL